MIWFLTLISLILRVHIVYSIDFRRGHFHGYNHDEGTMKNLSCHVFERKSSIENLTNYYRLWPNLYSSLHKSHGLDESLYGLDFAMDVIWKHQHPESCEGKQFLINYPVTAGFGAELHLIGAALGVAMENNRVFLEFPFFAKYSNWMVDNKFCKGEGKANYECYYEPYSSCTIFDALGPNAVEILNHTLILIDKGIRTSSFENIHIAQGATKQFSLTKKFRQESYDEWSGHKVVILHRKVGLTHFYPDNFTELIACSPIVNHAKIYWWRAISITYLVRPNLKTIQWINDHRISELDDASDFVSMYVRRGDKATEMKLIPVEEFINAIHLLENKHFIDKKILFLSSEDSTVLKEVADWNNHHKQYKLYITEVFNRSGLFAEKTSEERNQLRKMNMEVHPEEEYLSMILNVHYLTKATSFICTLSSNFCRIIDELRSTVGAKVKAPYVDLSIETCANPPCLFDGIKDFGP